METRLELTLFWYNYSSFMMLIMSFLCHLTGHLIGCDKKSEIVRYFPGRLCDKIGLLCNKFCNFFRANLHCFTGFQRRKTTLMLFTLKFECTGIIKHLFENKIVKFVRLLWPAKEKGHLLNITWCHSPADHTACLWNQNDFPDTAIEGFRCLTRLSLLVYHLK